MTEALPHMPCGAWNLLGYANHVSRCESCQLRAAQARIVELEARLETQGKRLRRTNRQLVASQNREKELRKQVKESGEGTL